MLLVMQFYLHSKIDFVIFSSVVKVVRVHQELSPMGEVFLCDGEVTFRFTL